MIAPPRPALAALEAGIAHLAVHHRLSRAADADPRVRLLALRVALNILKELDTLLGHAVIETAAIAGVVLRATGGTPVRRAFAELVAALGAEPGRCAGLAEAERTREGLVHALARRRGPARHRLPVGWPDVVGATYRRVAADLRRMPHGILPAVPRPPAAPRGDDAPGAYG